MIFLVRRRQHFAFVNEVHLERFEHLGLDKMADAHLGHHRNRHRLHDVADNPGHGHARHATFFADVRGDALERHHRARSRLLGDLGLLRVSDVHDDAALEHLRQPDLDPPFIPVQAFSVHGSLLGS